MLILYTCSLSITAGIILGIIYGYWAILNFRRTINLSIIKITFFSLIRLIFIFFLFYYLLQSQQIQNILVIVSFFISYWAIIFYKNL